MQEKIDGIKAINESMWRAYKEFLSGRDRGAYQKAVACLEWGYEAELRWFCRNLASAWEGVIGLLEACFEEGADAASIHSCVSDIQNSAWSIYRGFMTDHAVPEYTRRAAELTRRHSGDKDMKLFAQTLILSWVPVINSLAEDFRNGGANNEVI